MLEESHSCVMVHGLLNALAMSQSSAIKQLGSICIGIALLLAGCGDHGNGTCSKTTDCDSDSVCICPGGARECSNAVCAKLCMTSGPGSPACPDGGGCAQTQSACCEGAGAGGCSALCTTPMVCAADLPATP